LIHYTRNAIKEMKLLQIDRLYTTRDKPVVSFEVFPPKKSGDASQIYPALEILTGLQPEFISVTCGAGGSERTAGTRKIASAIQKTEGVLALAHLTCVGNDKAQVFAAVDGLRREGVTNVLALRGDLPAGGGVPEGEAGYRYAKDLIADLSSTKELCVGAACYPEGHIDCDGVEESLRHLKLKQEAGASFFITQLCFRNDLLFRFLEQARAMGITAPISCGIMPILSRSQVQRMIFMCGVSLPSGIVRLLHKYENSPEDLRKAGIEYAARQVEELAGGGVDGVHIYTMNQPDIARIHMHSLQANGYR